jgi:hypothetical protein
MFRLLMLLALVLVPMLLAGCDDDDDVLNLKGSGVMVSKEYDLAGFNAISASQAFRITVTRGETFSVVVRMDEEVEDYVLVEKSGDTLKLGLDPDHIYNLSNVTMEADVTMPDLRAVDLSGASRADLTGFESSDTFAGDLSGASRLSGDLHAGDVALEASGGSSITLTGSGQDLKIDASGASRVDLAEFAAEDVDVQASGASTVTVSTSGRLEVDASGASQVTYLGEPSLGAIETSGSSSVQAG